MVDAHTEPTAVEQDLIYCSSIISASTIMPTPATASTSLSGSEATTKPEEEEERVAAVSEDALFNVQSTSPAFSTQSDAASAAASAATQRYGRFRLQGPP
ncbi:hypothetical protein BGZ47_001657, partial [Haplosporangium gracile]